MEAFKVVSLINKYGNCPVCGNDKVGNGEGTLVVEEDTFKRTCKCGFEIILNEEGEEII
ncbi:MULTISPECIES: DUF3797 domain-containing protein [Clostridium]|uniref:DUF3797 domain-containing protein n=1 Tax=Clostridium TaxID=1485 RepID=UPI0001668E6C|nr:MULTISPECIES: DUF3797 domain-containing protein [Clostridium]EDS77272.1 conserved hypothetical protein [Clostridium botulinum C str. Eklund]MCD3223811.1 DUF3797 domain-containing protein [Clostridium botulinum C/D]MCD3295289.1 DUF3797 domain-containing protein [Clostridium botulinum C/D]NEZ50258.1 DUF3797 domain-containing protein [Clostridium botulinum]